MNDRLSFRTIMDNRNKDKHRFRSHKSMKMALGLAYEFRSRARSMLRSCFVPYHRTPVIRRYRTVQKSPHRSLSFVAAACWRASTSDEVHQWGLKMMLDNRRVLERVLKFFSNPIFSIEHKDLTTFNFKKNSI